ncbi:hypothetical protein ACSEQ3_01855 [Pseudomonas aeruginosa]
MPFSKELHHFLTQEMCINTRDLTEKISALEQPTHISDIYRLLEEFFIATQEKEAEAKIQKIFLSYEHLFDSEPAYAIIDPMRHAFDGFAYGGLHQLFTRQENEAWYPKIRLTKELEPNDIATLDETVEIYRGCSTSEYASKIYGQSWSTSKKVAEEFAYIHYQSQSWFNAEDRVVLQSTIPRSAIFYSKQHCEFEVVVNTNHLGAVRALE